MSDKSDLQVPAAFRRETQNIDFQARTPKGNAYHGMCIPMKPFFKRGTMNRFASRSGVLRLVVGPGFITELPSHSQFGGADLSLAKMLRRQRL